MNGSERRGTSRRTFLKGTTAVGSAAGLAVAARAGRAQETGGRASEIRLGGEVSAWHGRAPDAIGGETNPTLPLEAGESYKLVWENMDGQPHNVVIIDSEGNELERTQVISGQGATQTLTFTATPEMAEYYCEVHPSSMRGDVEVTGGGGGGGGNQTTTPANGTQTPANGTQAPAEQTTTAETTGPQIPQDFDTQLTFTARRFAETIAGSLDYLFLERNLDRYRDQLANVLEARNLSPNAQPSFRQVGQTGLAIESTLDGAGLYASMRRFYPEFTPEYVARVARRARNEAAVTDVLAGVPTVESPDRLLQTVERRSGAVAESLVPQYASFAPAEGAIHGGLLAVKDAGRLLRHRQNIVEDMDACVGRAGQIGAGFLLVGRSIQSMLRPEGMTEQQAAVGVLAGTATMALGDQQFQRCLWVDPATTTGNATMTVGGETTTAGGEATTTGTTTNASSLAGSRSADAASAVGSEFGVLATLGGCAGLVGHLLSSSDE